MLGMEVNLMQATLDNGTVIEAESWEAGEPVFIVTEDGTVPLPEGTYTTEEGVQIVVAEEGVIAEVMKGDKPEEEEAAEEMQAVSEFVTKADLEAAIASVVEKLSAQKSEVKAEPKAEPKKKELSAEDMPAATPIKANPERNAEKQDLKLYANKRAKTTEDVVLNKIFNIKKTK